MDIVNILTQSNRYNHEIPITNGPNPITMVMGHDAIATIGPPTHPTPKDLW
jgi:hypothetical protein